MLSLIMICMETVVKNTLHTLQMQAVCFLQAGICVLSIKVTMEQIAILWVIHYTAFIHSTVHYTLKTAWKILCYITEGSTFDPYISVQIVNVCVGSNLVTRQLVKIEVSQIVSLYKDIWLNASILYAQITTLLLQSKFRGEKNKNKMKKGFRSEPQDTNL